MINNYILKSSKHFIYLLFITGFISIYMSYFSIDPSLSEGKNIINFIFLYCLGHFLYVKKSMFLRISQKKLIIAAIIINVLLFLSLRGTSSTLLGNFIYVFFFPYYSIGLIVNSMIIFCIFVKLEIKSRLINVVAGSMFSVYLIHHQPFLMQYVIQPIVSNVEGYCNGDVSLFVGLIIITSIILICCVIVDLTIKPIVVIFEGMMFQKMQMVKLYIEKEIRNKTF